MAGGAAGGLTAGLMGYNDALSKLLFGREPSELSADEKMLIANIVTLAGAATGGAVDGSAGVGSGASAGRTEVENNYLSAGQSLIFDKELSDCRKSGGDCQAVIDKWKKVSDEQSHQLDETLKDNPLESQVVDKEIVQGGFDMSERPGWLSNIGADVMNSDEAKAYVQQWNGQDLASIDVNSPKWTKYAAFVSDPENQAALASLGMLGIDLVLIAKK